MEEINLPGTTLQHILFDSDKTAFENTVSMTQADIRTGKEMKEVLQNSMANLRSSKNVGIDLRKAVDYLKIKRRQKEKRFCICSGRYFAENKKMNSNMMLGN